LQKVAAERNQRIALTGRFDSFGDHSRTDFAAQLRE
jgi:hypothetical protein